MLPARFDLDYYNAFNKGTCVDPDAVDHGLLDQRSIFHCTPDLTPCISPRHLHLKNCVGLSPTREKLREIVWFITYDKSKGLILTVRFRASLKHKNVGQTKFIKTELR